jgi:hypothetical protein
MLYLKMEAQPGSETSCLLKKLEDGQSPKKGDCVSENLVVAKRLETV